MTEEAGAAEGDGGVGGGGAAAEALGLEPGGSGAAAADPCAKDDRATSDKSASTTMRSET
ncbi:MAG TPA: hypothetical protein VMI54_27215 [Polyangiaceae bacterium]|nr:hypothetical protein [Polyangiaceae bacterium]